MTICDFIGGWIAGMVGLVVGHPIDTVKVRQQIGGVSMRDAIKNTYRNRGWKGFYRGLTVPMYANGLLNAVYFSVYGWTVDLIVDYRETKVADKDNNEAVEAILEFDSEEMKPTAGRMSQFKPKGIISAVKADDYHQPEQATLSDCFIGGWVAGWVTMIFACPVELIKVKLQSNLITQRIYRNPWHVMKRVYVSQGAKGFYRGVWPMTHRNFIGAALNFLVMKQCIDLYPHSPKNWYQIIPAAGFAGMVSWWVAVPFDVIKTRMQSDNLKRPRYKGMFDTARQIVRRQGVRGLFRGLWPLSLRQLPVNAATFVVYEWFHTNCHTEHRDF